MGSADSKTLVKICGITELSDALCAVDAGADAVGFIFAESPRQVRPREVEEMAKSLPDAIAKVGLFVNSPVAYVLDTISACGLNAVQLHGDESPEYVAEVAERFRPLANSGRRWPALVKAFSPKAPADLEQLSLYAEADAFLVDAFVKGVRGGSGKTADWSLARAAKEFGPLILAGGLNGDNIETAISRVCPMGVDTSSGVESAPGKKDHKKIRDFIGKVKK